MTEIKKDYFKIMRDTLIKHKLGEQFLSEEDWMLLQRQFSCIVLGILHALIRNESRHECVEFMTKISGVGKILNSMVKLEPNYNTDPYYLMGKFDGLNEFIGMFYEIFAVDLNLIEKYKNNELAMQVLQKICKLELVTLRDILADADMRQNGAKKLAKTLRMLLDDDCIRKAKLGKRTLFNSTPMGDKIFKKIAN